MDLSIYEIIKGPVLSDKAYKLNQKYKKLVLFVHPNANKPQVKQALELLFKVKVEKINSLRRKGKEFLTKKRVKKQKSLRKRVIVTLKEGYSLDLFDQANVDTVTAVTK